MMPIEKYIEKMKLIDENLSDFLSKEIKEEENFDILCKNIESQNIQSDKHHLKEFLYLLNTISNYHHRYPNFFNKIEKILKIFKEEMTKYYSNWQLFSIFKTNKRVLLFLIEEKIITIDKDILDEMNQTKYKSFEYQKFFLPEIKSFIEKEKNYFNNIVDISNEIPDQFYEKRRKGENDGLLYQIIQNDSIEDFITFVNKERYSLKSFVERSIFETNLFLLKKEKTSLIEYAAFFGSVQIFKYLYLNGAEMISKLWIYAIHGYDEEIIHILENNTQISHENCIIESIKCHHNDITNYIHNNFLNDQENIQNILTYSKYMLKYFNFLNFPNRIDNNLLLFYACEYDYYTIVQSLLSVKEVDINWINSNKKNILNC